MASIDDVMSDYAWPNILFLTLDSCRFDTAAMARTPALDKVGALHRALSPGTFTLPSHMSFFAGMLPHVPDQPHLDYYSREARRLWRLYGARKASTAHHLTLEGGTLVEGFRKAGYFTMGGGGVRWFRSPILRAGFDKFVFRGVDDYSNAFVGRERSDFVLADPERLVDPIPRAKPWFLFANLIETHAPYDDGILPLSDELLDIQGRAQAVWSDRRLKSLQTNVTPAEFKLMHAAQIRALETADARIQALIDLLPRPFIAIICGDHGECFGENGAWGHCFPAPAVMEVPIYIGAVT